MPKFAIFMLLCAALLTTQTAPSFAQNPERERRTITVNGVGTASARPDRAQLSAGVISQAPTAAAALSANSTAMEKVFSALKSIGIPENKIQTSDFSISPQYAHFRPDMPQPQEQKIVGYQVSNQVVVILDDLSKLGQTLDVLVRNGANQAGGISFTFADAKPLAEKARRDAVTDAIAKAKTLASAAGVSLGPILSIQESGGFQPMPRYMAMAEAKVAQDVPVAAGESTISISVTLTYEIQ